MYNEIEEYTIYNFYNSVDIELRREKKRDQLSKKIVLQKIVQKWDLRLYDQLGFLVQERPRFNEIYNYKEFSFHHLRISTYDNGPNTIHNGSALLRGSGHPQLHNVQNKCPELYNELLKLLLEINEQLSHPTKKQLLLANEIFCIFEKNFSAATNVKDEPLIREEYTRRINPKNIYNYYGLNHYRK